MVQCADDIFVPYRFYFSAEQMEVEGVVHFSVDDSESDLLQFGIGQFSEDKIPEVEVIDVYKFQKVQYDNQFSLGTAGLSHDRL